MQRLLVVVAAFSATACSRDDSCARFVEKMTPVMGTFGDKPFTGDARATFLAECEKPDSRMKKDPVFKCVLDARDSDAVSACMASSLGEYKKKSRATEAKVQLNRIGKLLKMHYAERETFPAGKVGPVPAEPCCKATGGRCSPDPRLWTGVWQQLEFEIDHTFMFQYAYESDGKTATATATGDLDCDGETVVYALEVTIENGNPTATLVEPDTRAD